MTSSSLNPVFFSPEILPEDILSSGALDFLAQLHERFNQRRVDLLALRKVRQLELDKGKLFDFLPDTLGIRQGDWKVAPIPADLLDRRVEITGPVDRKMIINALNSGAKVFMADFEDSTSPTWRNILDGQVNLYDAVRGTIQFQNTEKKIVYRLNETIATLMVRPRGWHLEEKNHLLNGERCSASLFDFGLYFFHNAQVLIERGSGPYFYLPKMESHLEARLWNDVFVFAQEYLKLPIGTIKATVLIETLPAAFEMDEILYELRDHSAGLNCGRWDYIFSFIKKTKANAGFVFPDRSQVGMDQHCMDSYSKLLIETCHKRGVHAMGGMAAQIPIKNDESANQAAMQKVQQDKLREVVNGHDGTWVAHPALIPLAMEIFNQHMPTANQIDKSASNLNITAEDLLKVPQGTITATGIVNNIDIALQYTEAWISGKGCVPIYNLMEDAATAEISRTQLWQWLHTPGTTLSDGRTVDTELINELFPTALKQTAHSVGQETFKTGKFSQAEDILRELIFSENLSDFLTLTAYDLLD